MKSDYNEFRARLLKLSSPRNSKSTKTYTSKGIIRSIQKQNPKTRIVSEDTYSKIIRRVNELLVEELFQNAKVALPYTMGYIMLYSNEGKIYEKDGKLIRTMPINWGDTLKLWYDNDKAFKKQTLLRDLPKKIYSIKFVFRKVGFKNQQYYTFKPCRSIKLKLKNLILNNKNIPAYEHGIYHNT